MIRAMIISMLIGNTAEGFFTNNPAIAMANTARTNHVRNITNIKNIILIRLFITLEDISAIDFPFSLALITNAPKSCTAPINIVPTTTHNTAGSHPQYTAMHGPIMGAAPAMEVKW